MRKGQCSSTMATQFPGLKMLEALGVFLLQFASNFSSICAYPQQFHRFQRFLTQLTTLQLCQCQVGHHASFGGSEALLRCHGLHVPLLQSPNLSKPKTVLVGPLWDPRFCHVSSHCLKGKGLHRSAKSFEEHKSCQIQCAHRGS